MSKRNYFLIISCNNNQNSDKFVTSKAITQPRGGWGGGGGSYTKELGHKREGRGDGRSQYLGTWVSYKDEPIS